MSLVLAALSTFVNWQDDITAGDAAVALGTLVLAAFTLALALQTKRLAVQTTRDVAFTQEELHLTRQSIEAADMPFVIAMPIPASVGIVMRDSHMTCRLWNIGKGPAMVRGITLRDGAGNDLLDELRAAIPIAAGQAHDDSIPAASPPFDEAAAGSLTIHYSHTSRQRLSNELRSEV